MRVTFDAIGQHDYETGVDHGMLYKYDKTTRQYSVGVVWNGLTSVTDSPSGGEPTPIYADNIKYLNLFSAEDYAVNAEAYTYPKSAYSELDGQEEIAPGVRVSQQERKPFGFCWRTLLGDDVNGTAKGYKLHIVYGCQAAPTEKGHSTVNDTPEAGTFSWSISTTPVNVPGAAKPSAKIEINSTDVDATALKTLEDLLYGTDGVISYIEVTDTTGKNPVSEGWYEDVEGTKVPTTDTVPAVITTYNEVLSPSGDPSAQEYYEKVGGEYVASTDTEVDSTKTYYTKVETPKTYYVQQETGGTDPMLPLPARIAEIFGAQG